jgi:hypothetical protein
MAGTICTRIPHHIHRNHDARRSSRRKYRSPIPHCPRSDHAVFSQDISAAEQVSLNHLTVPELSPSDHSSNASSPSSSEPVTPVDQPSLAAAPDPLVIGKHQPDPRPYRPVAKSTSRGTVWRARQVLFSLGKRKRQPSEDAGIPAGVQVLDSDDEAEEALESPAKTAPATSQVSHPFPQNKTGLCEMTHHSLCSPYQTSRSTKRPPRRCDPAYVHSLIPQCASSH